MKKVMDACALRHTVLANNIANSNTQGYRRKDVEFKKVFTEALQSGDPGKLFSASPEVKVDNRTPVSARGNNVATETELSGMLDNSILYGLSARVISGKYERMKKVISSK